MGESKLVSAQFSGWRIFWFLRQLASVFENSEFGMAHLGEAAKQRNSPKIANLRLADGEVLSCRCGKDSFGEHDERETTPKQPSPRNPLRALKGKVDRLPLSAPAAELAKARQKEKAWKGKPPHLAVAEKEVLRRLCLVRGK